MVNFGAVWLFAEIFSGSSFPKLMLHHATENVLPKFSPAPPFANWCRIMQTEHVPRSWFLTADFSTRNCIMLLSMFCRNFLRFLLSKFDVTSCYWACFAEIFTGSSFPKLMLHHATELVLPKFSLAPPFPNWCRIMPLSMFCGVDFWPLIYQLEIASCYWACFAKFFSGSFFPNLMSHHATEHVLPNFSPAPLFPNWCRIMLLSMFCGLDFLLLIFQLEIASCYWACFAEFFSGYSFPKLMSHRATEHVLRNFFPAPHFLFGSCIMLLSMFCQIFLRFLLSQFDVASCYWACFAEFFSGSSFPKLMSHHATEHVLRSWFFTADFSTRNCIMLLSMFLPQFHYMEKSN